MAFFADREEAAERLAGLLPEEIGQDWLVLALPRGGVPIAAVLAAHLGAPLGLLIVRKVGTPGNRELAAAAVTGPGPDELTLNRSVCTTLGLTREAVERLAEPEIAEIARRRRSWGGTAIPLQGRKVLIVDDGAATGTTLRAALGAARAQGAAQIAVALPVALGSVLEDLPPEVGPVICPHRDAMMHSVGQAYRSFPQVADDEVARLVRETASASGQ